MDNCSKMLLNLCILSTERVVSCQSTDGMEFIAINGSKFYEVDLTLLDWN